MKNDNNRKAGFIFSAIGIIPVVWLALLTAPYVSGGLVEIVRNLPTAINNPFSITVCEDSVKTVLIFLLAYGMGIGINSGRNCRTHNGFCQRFCFQKGYGIFKRII